MNAFLGAICATHLRTFLQEKISLAGILVPLFGTENWSRFTAPRTVPLFIFAHEFKARPW